MQSLRGEKKPKSESVDINALRKNDKLAKQVYAINKQLGLFNSDNETSSSEESEGDESESRVKKEDKKSSKISKSKKSKVLKKKSKRTDNVTSSESSDSDLDSSSSDRKSKSKKKRKDKKKKSGISAKSSDTVKYRQKYPQAHLRYEFVCSNVPFENLDLNLFVAGELEIISACRSSSEKQGRIELLKRLMYLNSTYNFEKIKTLYAAILRDIEVGLKRWSDDFGSVENAILNKNDSKEKRVTSFRRDRLEEQPKFTKSGDDEKIWFCSPYQRNICLHKGGHTVTVKRPIAMGSARVCVLLAKGFKKVRASRVFFSLSLQSKVT